MRSKSDEEQLTFATLLGRTTRLFVQRQDWQIKRRKWPRPTWLNYFRGWNGGRLGEMATIVNSLAAAEIVRWQKAWQGVGAHGDGEEVLAELLERYSEPHRAYHNLSHIRDCLNQLGFAISIIERTAEVEIAVWFHDAIYNPRRTDNEQQSAQWAEQVLAAAAVPHETIVRIANMIRLTDHQHAVGEEAISNDAAVLCDADLAILGAEPERFDRYDQQIREEYAWVSEPVYRQKRGEVLAGFLQRPRIYRTRPFFDRYEAQARRNLARVLINYS